MNIMSIVDLNRAIGLASGLKQGIDIVGKDGNVDGIKRCLIEIQEICIKVLERERTPEKEESETGQNYDLHSHSRM